MDLGASWIHGLDGNPLLPFVDASGYEDGGDGGSSPHLGNTPPPGVIVTEFGRGVQLHDPRSHAPVASERAGGFAEALFDMYARMRAAAVARGRDGNVGVSLQDYIDSDTEWLRAVDEEYNVDGFEGENGLLANGYTALLRKMSARFVDHPGVIRLNTEVDRIVMGPDSVSVFTKDSTEFTAPHVICTLPLGVLQHRLSLNSDSALAATTAPPLLPLFTPPLPARNLAGLSRLRAGLLDKVLLRFRRAFWPPAAAMMQAFSPDLPDDGYVSFFNYAAIYKQMRDAARGRAGGTDVESSVADGVGEGEEEVPQVLLAFVSARAAEELEAAGDAAAVRVVVRQLERMFGHDAVAGGELLDAHFTTWRRDPFARGSYSHIGLEGDQSSFENAGASVMAPGGVGGGDVVERLHFAGEHTIRDHFATVHGAVLSGFRAAEKVAASLGAGGNTAVGEAAS
ncbi:putative lysine-specific histone demethylase 1 [Cladochytrium tenue]|nr:putative lysine-specific histone demethylase 1 [Cladochytrium tenue]